MDVAGLGVGDWAALVARMGVELDQSARAHGALTRRRGVADAASLLRLALVYGTSDFGLRMTVAWAEQADVAAISNVALLNRLRGAEGWLGWILSELLSGELKDLAPSCGASGYRMRLVDGSVIRANSPHDAKAGSPGWREGWRLHAVFDLAGRRFSELSVTPLGECEALDRLPVRNNDILVADRGYGDTRGLEAVLAQGGHFVVRRKRNARRLRDAAGHLLNQNDILQLAGSEARLDAPADIDVNLPAGNGDVPCRLIMIRLPADAAKAATERHENTAKRKNRRLRAEGQTDAQYLTILTDLPRDHLKADQICQLYRFRWQIEIAFKQLKTIAKLDQLRAIEPPLTKAAIHAKLILAVLSQSLMAKVIAFSPSNRSMA